MTQTDTYTELVSQGCDPEAAMTAADSTLDLRREQRAFMARLMTQAPTYTVAEAARIAAGYETIQEVV